MVCLCVAYSASSDSRALEPIRRSRSHLACALDFSDFSQLVDQLGSTRGINSYNCIRVFLSELIKSVLNTKYTFRRILGELPSDHAHGARAGCAPVQFVVLANC